MTAMPPPPPIPPVPPVPPAPPIRPLPPWGGGMANLNEVVRRNKRLATLVGVCALGFLFLCCGGPLLCRKPQVAEAPAPAPAVSVEAPAQTNPKKTEHDTSRLYVGMFPADVKKFLSSKFPAVMGERPKVVKTSEGGQKVTVVTYHPGGDTWEFTFIEGNDGDDRLLMLRTNGVALPLPEK
jgi:hypothetical protein